MESRIIIIVDEIALSKVKHLIPDLQKYSLGEFNELYHKDVKFVQVWFYDRTNIKDRYKSNQTDLCIDLKNAEIIKVEVKEYNKALEVAQKESANETLRKFAHNDYFYFSRVETDIGICHFNMVNRNKSLELKREQDEYEEHQNRLKSDPQYRRRSEWLDEADRPFGGAFSSWGDYHNYRNG